jgi:hypothetical protein
MKKYIVIAKNARLEINGSIRIGNLDTLAGANGYNSRKQMKAALGLPAFIAAEEAYFARVYTSPIAEFTNLSAAKQFASEIDAQVAYKFRNGIKHI